MAGVSRMWTTLASLAVAMTATAALLGRIDHEPHALQLVDAQVAAAAADVVLEDTLAPGASWQVVYVCGCSPGNGRSLRASGASGHFLVHRDGSVAPSSRWRQQQFGVDGDGVIRIELVQVDGRYTTSQQAGVKAAIVALRKLYPQLRVDWAQDDLVGL